MHRKRQRWTLINKSPVGRLQHLRAERKTTRIRHKVLRKSVETSHNPKIYGDYLKWKSYHDCLHN